MGRVTTRVTNDVEALYELLRSLGTFLGEFVPFFVALGIMLSADVPHPNPPRLRPNPGRPVPAFRRAMRNVYRRARESLSWLNQQMQENLAGLTVVQLYGREQENLTRYQATNGKTGRGRNARPGPGNLLWGAHGQPVEPGPSPHAFPGRPGSGGGGRRLTLGTVVLFTRYIDLLFQPLAALGEQYNCSSGPWRAGNASSKPWTGRRFKRSQRRRRPSPRLAGALRFEQLSFAYEAGTPVLKGLTFTVPAREHGGHCGPHGIGKEYLIRLLSRLYTVDPGQLFIDDVDVTQIHSRELRRRIGVVLQDFHVFAGTVLDNITLEDPAITREKAEAAAATVGADGFIRALPQGFDTVLAEQDGICLKDSASCWPSPGAGHGSGNPRARRSHGKHRFGNGSGNPGGLKRLRADRTMVIIAHRLATIVDADQVLVLVNGTQEALGSPETVLMDSPTYARMHRLQFEEGETLEGEAKP